jgi:hypothetical protein
MTVGYLEYPLAKGYIHHWLVAGPQAVEVKELERFTGPEWKLQIAKFYYQPEPDFTGEPAEYSDFKAGEYEAKWNYVRTRDDHFVELSKFYHLTHYLRAWAYCEINSQFEQELTFILTTNGPADLWINGQHVHRQEHFYHQIPNRVPFTAKLVKGVNKLLVRLEEVAARECPFTMALQMLEFKSKPGKDKKTVRIPTLAPSPERRLLLEKIFEASYLTQDVYTREEEIRLHVPEFAATDFTVRIQNPQAQIYAEHWRQHHRDREIVMGNGFQFPQGPFQIMMMPGVQEYYEANVRITRFYDTYISNNVFSTRPYGTYETRRAELLLDAARREYNVFSEFAKMELGYWQDLNMKTLFESIEGINQRKDCSDFYLCGLLGALYRFGDQPDFPQDLKLALEGCILNFKYWNDEPGSDAMCYTTENHSLLFHTCEILAGQLYPDRVFSNVGQTGQWHVEKGERLAMEWLKKRAAYGFIEWDSNTYFEEDTLSLSTLATHARNPQVWEMAAVVLDKLFYTLAINSFQGVFGSTHGRTYTPMIKGAYRECTAGVSRLLWGMGIYNDHILGPVALALSDYQLPEMIAAIAADGSEELWNREQHTGAEVDFKNSGSRGTGVNKVTYKTPDTMLCSAQDWHPGEKGYQQHIWQATLSPLATVFTTHPPCAAEDGSHRPNFWHGNETLPRVAQWKDTLIAVYNFAADDWMGFTHAYFPAYAFMNYDVRDNWAFGRYGDGYIALTAAKGLEWMTTGDNAFRELRSHGTPNIWVCQMGRQATDGSFERFIERVLAMPVTFTETEVELTNLRGDTLQFGWKGPLLLNGKVKKITGFKHYDSPFCTSKLAADTMDIKYGYEMMRLNFGAQPEAEAES